MFEYDLICHWKHFDLLITFFCSCVCSLFMFIHVYGPYFDAVVFGGCWPTSPGWFNLTRATIPKAVFFFGWPIAMTQPEAVF